MKSITCAAILIISFVAVQAQPGPEKIQQFKENVEKCGTELKVDVKFITEARGKPDFAKFKTPEYKCFSKCLMEKSGSLDAQGNLVMAKIKECIPELTPEAEKYIQECADNHVEADLCERYNNMHTCMFEKMKAK